MSNNQEIIEARLAAYIDDELDPAERTEIENHLLQNPQYRGLLDELKQGREFVGSLPREAAPAEFSEAYATQLERSGLLGDDPTPERPPMRIGYAPRWIAAAAILFLALGLGAIVMYVLPDRHHQTVAVNIGDTPKPGATTDGTKPPVAPASPNDGKTSLPVKPAPLPTPAPVAGADLSKQTVATASSDKSGSGEALKSITGTGAVVLSGTNTYSGNTTIGTGTISPPAATAAPTPSDDVVALAPVKAATPGPAVVAPPSPAAPMVKSVGPDGQTPAASPSPVPPTAHAFAKAGESDKVADKGAAPTAPTAAGGAPSNRDAPVVATGAGQTEVAAIPGSPSGLLSNGAPAAGAPAPVTGNAGRGLGAGVLPQPTGIPNEIPSIHPQPIALDALARNLSQDPTVRGLLAGEGKLDDSRAASADAMVMVVQSDDVQRVRTELDEFLRPRNLAWQAASAPVTLALNDSLGRSALQNSNREDQDRGGIADAAPAEQAAVEKSKLALQEKRAADETKDAEAGTAPDAPKPSALADTRRASGNKVAANLDNVYVARRLSRVQAAELNDRLSRTGQVRQADVPSTYRAKEFFGQATTTPAVSQITPAAPLALSKDAGEAKKLLSERKGPARSPGARHVDSAPAAAALRSAPATAESDPVIQKGDTLRLAYSNSAKVETVTVAEDGTILPKPLAAAGIKPVDVAGRKAPEIIKLLQQSETVAGADSPIDLPAVSHIERVTSAVATDGTAKPAPQQADGLATDQRTVNEAPEVAAAPLATDAPATQPGLDTVDVVIVVQNPAGTK